MGPTFNMMLWLVFAGSKADSFPVDIRRLHWYIRLHGDDYPDELTFAMHAGPQYTRSQPAGTILVVSDLHLTTGRIRVPAAGHPPRISSGTRNSLNSCAFTRLAHAARW